MGRRMCMWGVGRDLLFRMRESRGGILGGNPQVMKAYSACYRGNTSFFSGGKEQVLG